MKDRLVIELRTLNTMVTNEAAERIEALERGARRWYRSDGSHIELDAAEVIARRKSAARFIARAEAALGKIVATRPSGAQPGRIPVHSQQEMFDIACRALDT